MQTYWERRRNNQEENHSSSQMDVTAVNPGSSPGEKDKGSDAVVGKTSCQTSGSLNEKRPTKKNSQKENKKHPYKKVRK